MVVIGFTHQTMLPSCWLGDLQYVQQWCNLNSMKRVDIKAVGCAWKWTPLASHPYTVVFEVFMFSINEYVCN